jgi:hypothetical protein
LGRNISDDASDTITSKIAELIVIIDCVDEDLLSLGNE